MKKIIYTHPDGGLSVIHPTVGARLAFFITLADGAVLPPGANSEAAAGIPPQPVDSILRFWPVPGAVAKWAETEDQFVARIRAKDVPADAIDVQIVDESAIPTDRTFRNAWTAGAGRVEHDMAKAREIKREQLRGLRKPKMEALDIAYMRADELGDIAGKRHIAAQKQALRDVTMDQTIDAAMTPDELKAVIPEALR